MRKLIVGTNLKMYKSIAATVSYLSDLKALTANLGDEITLFVIPSYTALSAASAVVADHTILLGAQNMHPEEQGQYTGEISPLMLEELGIDLVEIGHSERRHLFGETDAEENAKVLSALAHGFRALLCIGETADQKKNGISDELLRIQIKVGLRGVTSEQAARIWIAYEPVWAIGVNGTPAEPAYVAEKHAVIREILSDLFPDTYVPILYGGSVNPKNANSLIELKDVDGLFVGRAAWEAAAFNALIRAGLKVWRKKRNDGEL